jgi:hypothetical protein
MRATRTLTNAAAAPRARARLARAAAAAAAPAAAPGAAAAPAAAPRPRVAMVSLGCPKNTVDGEVLLGDLARAGFDVADIADVDAEGGAGADALVINTCGFVEDAKAESIEAILEAARLKAAGRVGRVVVTGCLAQRYAAELAEQLPEADLVVGFERYGGLAASLREVLELPPAPEEASGPREGALAGSAARVQVGGATVGFRPEADRWRLTPAHSAYLRVAEGCNHACTFCAIPGFRCELLLCIACLLDYCGLLRGLGVGRRVFAFWLVWGSLHVSEHKNERSAAAPPFCRLPLAHSLPRCLPNYIASAFGGALFGAFLPRRLHPPLLLAPPRQKRLWRRRAGAPPRPPPPTTSSSTATSSLPSAAV